MDSGAFPSNLPIKEFISSFSILFTTATSSHPPLAFYPHNSLRNQLHSCLQVSLDIERKPPSCVPNDQKSTARSCRPTNLHFPSENPTKSSSTPPSYELATPFTCLYRNISKIHSTVSAGYSSHNVHWRRS